MMDHCRYCERDVINACRSTRCMEDARERPCFDALMRAGGGEYIENQTEASRRDAAFKAWARR